MLERLIMETEHEEIKIAGHGRLNRRVTFDRRIEVPSQAFFFFKKK